MLLLFCGFMLSSSSGTGTSIGCLCWLFWIQVFLCEKLNLINEMYFAIALDRASAGPVSASPLILKRKTYLFGLHPYEHLEGTILVALSFKV